MATTDDQQFESQTAGQADWDSGLNANIVISERGYHMTGQAGTAINTGHVTWLSSAGFLYPFDINSGTIKPHGLSYTSAASGESVQVLLSGIIRSLDIHSNVVPGLDAFVSALTPGMVVSSFAGANRRVGWGVSESGLRFDPSNGGLFPEKTEDVASLSVVVSSIHTFELEVGRRGMSRRVHLVSDSGDLMSVRFFSKPARAAADLLFTVGSVTTIGSHIDLTGFPWENLDTGSYAAVVYGEMEIEVAASVTSTEVGVTLTAERFE